MSSYAKRGPFEVECPHCGVRVNENPIHRGEIARGVACRECREKFVVHGERKGHDDDLPDGVAFK